MLLNAAVQPDPNTSLACKWQKNGFHQRHGTFCPSARESILLLSFTGRKGVWIWLKNSIQEHSKSSIERYREHAGPSGRVLAAFQQMFEHQKHPGLGTTVASGELRVPPHRRGVPVEFRLKSTKPWTPPRPAPPAAQGSQGIVEDLNPKSAKRWTPTRAFVEAGLKGQTHQGSRASRKASRRA